MGEWDHRGGLPFGDGAVETSSDHFIQPIALQELGNRQLADRNDQLRSEQGELGIEPFPAVGDLYRIRDTVTTRFRLARETSAHRGDVDALA
jgi:hypothetical protein